LALFGRRLSERRDGLGMPASENLHKGGSRDFPTRQTKSRPKAALQIQT
jgi:hypothetical protein